MITEINLPKLEEAISYFKNFPDNHPKIKRGAHVSFKISPDERWDYVGYTSLARQSAMGLDKYGNQGLEYLAAQGFRVNQTVLLGVAQLNVTNMDDMSAVVEEIDLDSITQALLVLSTYRDILPYEIKLEELKKVRAIEEALRLST